MSRWEVGADTRQPVDDPCTVLGPLEEQLPVAGGRDVERHLVVGYPDVAVPDDAAVKLQHAEPVMFQLRVVKPGQNLLRIDRPLVAE